MQLDPDTIDKLRKQALENLFFFARAILKFKDLDLEIHKPICDALQNYQENTRMTIELPRTWFKSSLVTIAYSVWRAIKDPNIRILIAQNTHGNACKKLKAIANIFEKNTLFRALFYNVLPDKTCRWSSECLELRRTEAHPEGTFEAAGVGTAVVGRHFDVIIEDDTIAPKKDDMTGIVQQPTRLDIEKAIGYHILCHPMLIHPKESQIIIVGTRWAERDLLGYIYEKFPEYKSIQKTACEKNGESCTLLEGGKPTWERFNADVLREIERQEGPYMFACLYLGKPTAAINQVFKREWIRYRDRKLKDSYTCTSVDLASAEKEESSDPDFNVILTTAIEPKSGIVTVEEYTRERMSPSDVIDCIFQHHLRHHPVKILIEAIGYQRTLVHWIKRRQKRQGLLFLIEEIRSHDQAKVDRIRGLQPYFAANLVHIKPGMVELEHELLAFPKGAHDDVIDTLSMQVAFWVEMTEMITKLKPEKLVDQFSGESVIKELKDKVNAINQYPWDTGNLDDLYFDGIGSDTLRMEIRERSEAHRREVAFV